MKSITWRYVNLWCGISYVGWGVSYNKTVDSVGGGVVNVLVGPLCPCADCSGGATAQVRDRTGAVKLKNVNMEIESRLEKGG